MVFHRLKSDMKLILLILTMQFMTCIPTSTDPSRPDDKSKNYEKLHISSRAQTPAEVFGLDGSYTKDDWASYKINESKLGPVAAEIQKLQGDTRKSRVLRDLQRTVAASGNAYSNYGNERLNFDESKERFRRTQPGKPHFLRKWIARFMGKHEGSLGDFLREYQIHVLYDLVFVFFKWVFFLYAGFLVP